MIQFFQKREACRKILGGGEAPKRRGERDDARRKRRRQKMFSSSPIFVFFVLFSSSLSTQRMALGSRIVDGTSRERDCECRCGETLTSTPTLSHLFVGDPEKCTKKECELKFPETCVSTEFVEATYVSCLCSCGGHPLEENLRE